MIYLLDVWSVWTRLTVLATFAPLLVILTISVHRLWFHPLAKYPGPFWAKLTNCYAAYHSWKGDLHIDIWRSHEQYGDYIRYGPNRLIFNTTTALRDAYVVGSHVQKSKAYMSMMHRVANTITQRDKALHAKQRRLLSHGFSEAALRAYEGPITDHTRIFCECLAPEEPSDAHDPQATGQWSQPKDMADWCDYLTFDITLDVVYGFKSRMLSAPDNRPLLDALQKSNVRVGVMIPLYFLKNTLLDRYLFPSAIMARYAFIGFVRKLLLDRASAAPEPQARPNIFQILLSANDGEGLSQNEIASESTNLITAGFETTSTVLSSLFFYLSRYPESYSKVTKEIRSTLSSTEELRDRRKVNQCTYLRACIDECMRMSPPVPAVPFREVQAGGATIDGHDLQGGCDVGTGIYSIHHSAKYFPEPHTFLPERWLDTTEYGSKESLELAQRAYNPFSVGSRQCIGKGLATMEMMSIFATVLYKFDFKIADGKIGCLGEGKVGAELGRNRVNEFQLYDHVIATKSGPVLQFRHR